MGVIIPWNRDHIIENQWKKFSIDEKIEGFKEWFVENGFGKAMYHVVNQYCYAVVAFSDENDIVHFRLRFTCKLNPSKMIKRKP